MRSSYWSSYVCSSDLVRKLQQVPLQRLRLTAEGVYPRLVEIGGGERAIPCRIEPPRAIVEAFGGDRDIVGVEHAVNKARRPVGVDEARCPLHCMVEQEIGRAHVCTPVTNAHLVSRFLLEPTLNTLDYTTRHPHQSTSSTPYRITHNT